MPDPRVLLERCEHLVDDGRRRAGAADTPFDDRIRAVVAAQRAAPLGLHRFDAIAIVVARVGERAVGPRDLVHREEPARGVAAQLVAALPMQASDALEGIAARLESFEELWKSSLRFSGDAEFGAQAQHELAGHDAEARAADHDGGTGCLAGNRDEPGVVGDVVGDARIVVALDIPHPESDEIRLEFPEPLREDALRLALEAEIDQYAGVAFRGARHHVEHAEGNHGVGELLSVP